MPEPVTPRRCPSRHRDAYDFRYVQWCPDCGAVKSLVGMVPWKKWTMPKKWMEGYKALSK